MALDARTLEAFARLAGNGDFQVFIEWLKTRNTDAVGRLAEASDIREIGCAQGEYRLTQEIIDNAGNAQGLLRTRETLQRDRRAAAQHIF